MPVTRPHSAVSQRHHEAVRVLVEAGVRVDIVAHDGTTARSIAAALGDTRLQGFIEQRTPAPK
jgi:fructose-1,6-bisphosphatase/sedoheptulose 1,7-bisphosphatase-like protein